MTSKSLAFDADSWMVWNNFITQQILVEQSAVLLCTYRGIWVRGYWTTELHSLKMVIGVSDKICGLMLHKIVSGDSRFEPDSENPAN